MKIHLMGIGGTGMASLAGMLQSVGHEIQGSDQGVYPPMSQILEAMNIPVLCPYDAKNLTPPPDLVVIGNVISRGNPEAEAVLSRGIPYESMPETIRKFFLQGKTSLVVAGTHGKTTTTSLLAWILESAGRAPGFFVGGKPKNFPKNFALGKGEPFVLEGDEYDTAFFDKGPKFLHYQPEHVLLTSVEFDHADIYDSMDQILESFRKLLRIIPASGSLVANLDFPEVRDLLKGFSGRSITYTMDSQWKGQAVYFGELGAPGESQNFRVHFEKEIWEFSWEMMGEYNVSNAVGVLALARELGLGYEELKKGFETFSGVARRQEKLGEVAGILLLDDFAHHPTAVKVTLEGVRKRFPDRRIWALFEPRSNTSKGDIFQDRYAESFRTADQTLIAPVFMPEKVKDGKILSVPRLVERINDLGPGKARAGRDWDDLKNTVCREARRGDVILLMSNGDFGGLGPKILKGLEEREKSG